MPWVKIPAEHHPVFREALPTDPRVSTKQMFGGIAAMVNGNMFGGLFARSAIVKLSAADQKAALALDGASPFDPMGNGRVMRDTVLLPDAVMDDAPELRAWLRRAFEYTVSLPGKNGAARRVSARPTGARDAPRGSGSARRPTRARAKKPRAGSPKSRTRK